MFSDYIKQVTRCKRLKWNLSE